MNIIYTDWSVIIKEGCYAESRNGTYQTPTDY
jgi:hypothetical protein